VENAPLPPGSALDQITAMLGLVLQSPQASEANAVQALYALGRLRTELADQTLKGALKGSSGAMRLNIARTLVARNDLTGLEAVSTALLNPKDLSPQLVSNLAGSLAGLKDPNAVPTLSVLIGTGNTEVQRGAAAALRQSSSPAALEPLSRLLNSSDLQTRYYAVIGLGEITGQNEWAPAFDEFQLHEDHYLLYWQNWARVNLH
jgi:HEAT repeat protein